MKLTFRDRTVLFFNYAFPLIFFFMFGGLFKAERGGAIVQVLTMVLTIGILGTGFFGAGIRSVQERGTRDSAALQSGPDYGRAHPGLVAGYGPGQLSARRFADGGALALSVRDAVSAALAVAVWLMFLSA